MLIILLVLCLVFSIIHERFVSLLIISANTNSNYEPVNVAFIWYRWHHHMFSAPTLEGYQTWAFRNKYFKSDDKWSISTEKTVFSHLRQLSGILNSHTSGFHLQFEPASERANGQWETCGLHTRNKTRAPTPLKIRGPRGAQAYKLIVTDWTIPSWN